MSRRAVAPVIGVVLFVAVTVVLAAVVGAFAIGVGDTGNAPEAAITADRNGNEINLTHHSGDPLDVTELTVRIFVDGEPLEKQPDVPFAGTWVSEAHPGVRSTTEATLDGRPARRHR